MNQQEYKGGVFRNDIVMNVVEIPVVPFAVDTLVGEELLITQF